MPRPRHGPLLRATNSAGAVPSPLSALSPDAVTYSAHRLLADADSLTNRRVLHLRVLLDQVSHLVIDIIGQAVVLLPAFDIAAITDSHRLASGASGSSDSRLSLSEYHRLQML